MPDNEWNQMLAAAAGEVLETMFFAGVFGPAEPGSSANGPHFAARLGFQGTPGGALTLRISEPVARVLAADFLVSGEDQPLTPAQVECVVCELANMVCGSLLSKVKTERHFRLSSPELLAETDTVPPHPPNQSLDLGEGVLDLWLTLEPYVN